MALYRGSTKLAGISNGFNPNNLGTIGQVLTRDNNGYGYADAPVTSVGGATGAVSLKTINGNSVVGTGNFDIQSAFDGTPYTQAEYNQLEQDTPSVLTDGVWRVIYE